MRQFAEDRQIEFLLHFTKLSNLDTILKYGLVTRDLIERDGANDLLNDSRRIDDTSAVCVSIVSVSASRVDRTSIRYQGFSVIDRTRRASVRRSLSRRSTPFSSSA